MSALYTVDVPMKHACAALGINRSTHYRSRSVRIRERKQGAQRRSPRKLDEQERKEILDVFHSAEFADQSPREIYGTLLSRGVCLASIRSMYRILASVGESRERRMQRPRQIWATPSLLATAPNQVWTWDISKLRGPLKGVFFYAFVVIDLFSRYVVGWMVERTENGTLAEQLLDDAHARHHIARGELTIHSDRGSPMTCDSVSDLFKALGITRSLGRPRVSNDNAFSESQFRTLKYRHDYPQQFMSLEHARAWLQGFITWYNDHHCHVGLALFTPADVFLGRVESIAVQRQAALDARYAKNPERFVHGQPLVRLPPKQVCIDPDQLHHQNSVQIQCAPADVICAPVLCASTGRQAAADDTSLHLGGPLQHQTAPTVISVNTPASTPGMAPSAQSDKPQGVLGAESPNEAFRDPDMATDTSEHAFPRISCTDAPRYLIGARVAPQQSPVLQLEANVVALERRTRQPDIQRAPNLNLQL